MSSVLVRVVIIEEKKFMFIERHGDEFEKPIDSTDLVVWEKYFEIEQHPHNLMFFEKIGHVVFSHNSIFHRLLRGMDYYMLKMFPILSRYGYEFNFVFKVK